jgi:hypothetical protein
LKKFIAIAISTLFILGLAATAFAIHAEIPAETQAVVAKHPTQITLGGRIRTRGALDKTTFDNDNPASSSYDQRVRLSTDVKVSDEVRGFVMLESGSGNTDVYTWGGANCDVGECGAQGVYTQGNTKQSSMDILEAWIEYTPEIVGVKIGHMPLALGNKIFFNHTKFGDDAILLYKTIDNVHIAALTAKFNERNKAAADDADAYVALFNYKGDAFNASGDVTYVDDRAFLGVSGGEGHLYNIGLRGDAKVAMLKVYADVEFQTGDYDVLVVSGDFKGFAAQVGAKTNLDGIDLGIEAGYGSGDDPNDTDTDIDTFVTSLGAHRTTPNAYIYGYRAVGSLGIKFAGIANTTYVKASATAPLAERLTGNLELFWLKASEDVSINGGPLDDSLGYEIDGMVKYQLGKGLVYWVEAGYLVAGDAYNFPTEDADNAYGIRHGIELTF